MDGERQLEITGMRRLARPGPQGRLLWLAFSLAAWLALALAVQPAQAFTPIPVEGGASEHRRITDAALGCRWADPTACWSAGGLDRLEVALKRPDITAVTLTDAAHCDSGDLAPDGTSPGDRGPEALKACRKWIRENLDLALTAADGLVDARGAPSRDARDCAWRVLRPRTALCDVDFHLGRALHAAQDFYSHTNWVDQPVKPEAVTIHNPQGLGGSGPIDWLAAEGDEPPPPGLMSGCFVFLPEAAFCHGRTRHADLNKDHRPDPASREPDTPRGAVGENFARAFDAASGETARIWTRFDARLVTTYGEVRGRAMSCILRGLPPSMCGSGLSATPASAPGAF
jgi:hypothetical protein